MDAVVLRDGHERTHVRFAGVRCCLMQAGIAVNQITHWPVRVPAPASRDPTQRSDASRALSVL